MLTEPRRVLLLLLACACALSASARFSVLADSDGDELSLVSFSGAAGEEALAALGVSASRVGDLDYFLVRGADVPLLGAGATVHPTAHPVALTPLGFDDPLYPDQWHLSGAAPPSVNAEALWEAGFTGDGVSILFLDDSLDLSHPELAGKGGALSWNYRDDCADPTPRHDDQYHGTPVAGVAAAHENNDACGVGVAYNAGCSCRVVIFPSSTVYSTADALAWNASQVTVSSNSWGYGNCEDDGSWCDLIGEIAVITAAINALAANGRGGLGAPIVFAAGNSGAVGGDVNQSPLTRHPAVLAVGAVGPDSMYASYSTPGAAVFISAPSRGQTASGETKGIITAHSVVSADGVARHCWDLFGGTSAATPIVSGVIALLFEAFPDLPLVELRRILAHSAAKVDETPQGLWTTNGFGVRHSARYGFGLVDAYRAFKVASVWPFPGARVAAAASSASVVTVQPSGIEVILLNVAAASNLAVETVSVTLGFASQAPAGAVVSLVSPQGTESVLLAARPDRGGGGAESYSADELRLTSHQFWGECASGTWTLVVEAGDAVVSVAAPALELLGTPAALCVAPVQYVDDAVPVFRVGFELMRAADAADVFPDGTCDVYMFADGEDAPEFVLAARGVAVPHEMFSVAAARAVEVFGAKKAATARAVIVPSGAAPSSIHSPRAFVSQVSGVGAGGLVGDGASAPTAFPSLIALGAMAAVVLVAG